MIAKRWVFLLCLLSVALLLVGCAKQANQPATETKANKPVQQQQQPVLVTGAEALQKMEAFARGQWAMDAMPVHLESETNQEADGRDGRATIWRAVFMSSSRQRARYYVWSGSVLKDAPPMGVSARASEIALAPEMTGAAFEPFLLKTDSNKAFSIAQDHGGKKILKKNPEQRVNYIAEIDRRKNTPVWLVIYGTDMNNKKGYGAVHGTTGEFLKGGS